jgi:hypothetical protein
MEVVGLPSSKKFNSMARPALTTQLKAEEFVQFYWLKAELIRFCSAHSIPQAGSKQDITTRIAFFLQNGYPPATIPRKGKMSKGFNWDKDPLTLQTIITDRYKNSQRVRDFFKECIGPHFSFNVVFLQWMKDNTGRTLSDAVEAWIEIHHQKKSGQTPGKIAPQFQYNQYMRDFLADNPRLTPNDARHCWNMKREQAGPHKYKRSDLVFLKG